MKRVIYRVILCGITFSLFLSTPTVKAADEDEDENAGRRAQTVSEQVQSEEDADELPVESVPKKTKKAKRRLASADVSSTYADLRVSNPRSKKNEDVEIRLMGLAGTSAMGNSSADPSFVNVALNLSGDFRFWKYVGVDLEVHGDAVTGKYTDGTATTSPQLSKQVSGGLINLKAQYPFYTGNVRWVPKAGAGYGMQMLEFASDSPSSTASGPSSTTTLQGIYAIGGLDLEPSRKVVLFVDYAHSLGATGTDSRSSSTTDIQLTNVNFDRFRIGGFYRFGENWGIGGQFVMRSVGWTGTQSIFAPAALRSTSGASQDTTMLQFLALFAFEL